MEVIRIIENIKILPKYRVTEANLDYKLKNKNGMLTTDEYICNLKRHGVTTTIPDEPYKGTNTSIYHFCTIHNHRFKAQPSNVMNGYPCPLCNKEKNRITNETIYKQKLLDKNIPVLLDDKYISHSEKVYHICLHCGNRWKTSPKYVLQNKFSCPECAKKETAKNKTKTQEEFKNEVHKVLGDSVSIMSNYIGTKNIINVHCNVCNHNWTPRAESLLSGHSCPKCKGIKTGNRCRKTIEQYKKEVNALYKDIIVIADEYKNANTPILHQCTSCLYTYYQTPLNVLNGYGKCPLCNKCYEISENEFIELLRRNGKQIKLLSPYRGKKDTVDCQCLICGYTWNSIAYSLLNTTFNCPNCAINEHKKPLISNDEFVEKVHQKFPNIELLHEYKGADNSMNCHCNICDYDWTVKHSNKLYYNGCPNCAGRIKKTHEQFLLEVQDIHDNKIKILSEYSGSHNKVQCECVICGHLWQATPSNLIHQKTGCPICTSSKSERLVQIYLDKHNILYVHPMKFDLLLGIGGKRLSYDFYLPAYNLLIECQGKQHEQPVEYFGGTKQFIIQKIHDIRKRKYAHDHNIKLLEIWYYENNKIDKILEQTLNNLKSESLETVIPA